MSGTWFGPPGPAGALRMSLSMAALLSTLACATVRPAAVSPDEIPTLQARLDAEPNNGDLRHRYAAALYAADRCGDALDQAERAFQDAPDNVVGPLVVGRCLEADGRLDEALQVYSEFQRLHPSASGVEAVEGQRRLAERRRAVEVARSLVIADRAGETGPVDPQAVAILPLLVSGDTIYQSLSRGLASIILSDLDLLQRFQLLERIEINAIMAELALGQSGAVDQQTAARVGRIIRAGRTVQGTADVSSEEQTRLVAAVVTDPDSDPASVEVQGRVEDLLEMEKQLVFGLSEAMGYVPTPAERARIEGNGTRNLLAMLAYSRGLIAEDAGDYEAAVAHFQQAVAEDPGFTQAGVELEAATAADAVATSSAGEVTAVGPRARDAVAARGQAIQDPLGDAISSSISDIASLGAERLTGSVGQGNATELLEDLVRGTDPPVVVPTKLTGTLRIMIIIPGT